MRHDNEEVKIMTRNNTTKVLIYGEGECEDDVSDLRTTDLEVGLYFRAYERMF